MIMKLQRSIVTGSDSTQYLLYNKSRSIRIQIEGEELAHFFKKGEYKVFVTAEQKDSKLLINDLIDDQGW